MQPDHANHPEGLALLRAAVANPEDRTARLVLADWLQERGSDQLAHFMRQSAAEGGWVRIPRPLRGRWKWWDTCYDGWPGICTLPDLTADEQKYWPQADDPVKGLRGLAELFTSPWITSLRLESRALTDDALKELVHFPNLAVLDICNARITDAGLTELTALNSLARLELRELRITDEGMKTIAPHPRRRPNHKRSAENHRHAHGASAPLDDRKVGERDPRETSRTAHKSHPTLDENRTLHRRSSRRIGDTPESDHPRFPLFAEPDSSGCDGR